MKVLLCSFLLLLGCSENNKNNMKTIKVIGTAYNAKAGALISSIENDQIYYIDGLKHWDDDLVEKTLMVSGKLKKEVHTKDDAKNKQGAWKQSSISNKYILVDAKWRLE